MDIKNPITSKGYYFSDTVNIVPGEGNIDVNTLTPKQAKLILKSDIINSIEKDDLSIIETIANSASSRYPSPTRRYPSPTRGGQILTTGTVDGELKPVWVNIQDLV